jgi:two-component system OmpR family response regulator
LDLFSTIEGVESNARILVVSACASSEDRTLGLLRGADDYLSKPFASAELSARIQSLMKRTKDLCIGVREIHPGMLYDFSQHRLHNGEDERQLTPGEARLFELFLRHKLHQLSRKVIETCMWTSDQYPTSTAVDVCVKRLRDRMHNLPITIKTVRGTGYALRFYRSSNTMR